MYIYYQIRSRYKWITLCGVFGARDLWLERNAALNYIDQIPRISSSEKSWRQTQREDTRSTTQHRPSAYTKMGDEEKYYTWLMTKVAVGRCFWLCLRGILLITPRWIWIKHNKYCSTNVATTKNIHSREAAGHCRSCDWVKYADWRRKRPRKTSVKL